MVLQRHDYEVIICGKLYAVYEDRDWPRYLAVNVQYLRTQTEIKYVYTIIINTLLLLLFCTGLHDCAGAVQLHRRRMLRGRKGRVEKCL